MSNLQIGDYVEVIEEGSYHYRERCYILSVDMGDLYCTIRGKEIKDVLLYET